jgi:sirohydrochlorin ferrochelatase
LNRPTLLAVAHGSRNPAAATTTAALLRQVERLAPVLEVQLGYVQHAEPTLADALDAAGPDAVVVPLLLSSGYHLSADIRGAVAAADASVDPGPGWTRVAGPLGPDPLLVTALVSRLAQAGVPTGTPVVLAAAGSSDPQAAVEVRAQADLLAAELGAPVVAAFAAAGYPTVPTAVAELRAKTARPVAVATYLLAPGQFHDSLAASGADWVTEPLGDHPALAALIIDRYRTHRAPARAA